MSSVSIHNVTTDSGAVEELATIDFNDSIAIGEIVEDKIQHVKSSRYIFKPANTFRVT